MSFPPPSLAQYILEGKALYEAQDYTEAHETLSQAIRLIEEDERSYWLPEEDLAELYLLRGSALMQDDEKATFSDPDIFFQVLNDFEQAIELLPEQGLYYKLRGRLYLRCTFAEYFDQAKSDFRQALQKDPMDTDSMKHLGEVLAKEEEYAGALEFLSRVLLDHEDPEVRMLRGVCFFRKNPPDFQAAAADFGVAQEYMPRLEELYVWRAQCFQEMDRIDEAIAEYDRLIAIAPQKAGYYVDRGALNWSIDAAAALEDYDKAIELEQHPLAYNNRACHLLEEGQIDAALSDMEKALPEAETYPVIYATLAEVYAARGDRNQMYHYLRLAIKHYYEDITDAMENPAFKEYTREDRFRDLLRS